MPNPAELSPGAVTIPEAELHEATFAEDAEKGKAVRCVRESLDPLLADDPMQWRPFVDEDGIYYPKKGDRVLLGFPVDGLPAIVEWWPDEAAEPDKPF